MAGKDAGKQDTSLKELRDLAKALETFRRDIRAETREIKDGISELKDGVSYCTDICNDVKDTAAEINNLRMEMQQLLKQNMDLKAENAKLTQRCEELEQYQRLNNLEVKGAPTGSNPLTVIKKIGESVGECVEDDDIDTCHWVRTPKPGVQNIIVRFVRRSKRNALLSKTCCKGGRKAPWTWVSFTIVRKTESGLDKLGHVVFFQAVLFGGDAADHSHDLEGGLLEMLDGVCASAVLLYVEAEDAGAIYCPLGFRVTPCWFCEQEQDLEQERFRRWPGCDRDSIVSGHGSCSFELLGSSSSVDQGFHRKP
ncbi:hypothetical protein HPB49_022608 [Dermacentor silvarum]|uniref:Uncharacterized protein n=1 Tax=Dermacentor silvarum TaxID=543639 RepID=A0ACB8DFN4_DERSI|nr:hypothetical protein HPB49_022608 [Dermacentor silvarum]